MKSTNQPVTNEQIIKLKKTKAKQPQATDELPQKRLKEFFKGFFINYCWVGIIVILLTVIVDLQIKEQSLIDKVLIEFFKTVGISIIVASVFTWASDSQAFIDRIQKLLKSVVVDRDFLMGLDPKKKSEVIKLLIKPSSFEKSIYTNIDDYYNFYVKQTLDISAKNVRSDYNINSKVYFDSTRNKLICEKIVNYRLYPNINGYEDIKVGFSDYVQGKVFYIRVWNQEGEIEEFENPKLTEKILDGEKMELATVDMSKYTINDKHLIVQFKTQECGYDHWYMAAIQTLQPTDGISYKIRCEDGIKVITTDTFGQGVNFRTEKNDTEASISTYQWLNGGAGICVIVSKPE